MRIVLNANAQPADGAGAVDMQAARRQVYADFLAMVDAIGSEYDEQEKLQDFDANGPLWLDKLGATVTDAQKLAAEAAATGGPGPGDRPVFTPKYRPRTRDEIWDLMFLRAMAGWRAAARNREKTLRDRSAPPLPDFNFTT